MYIFSSTFESVYNRLCRCFVLLSEDIDSIAVFVCLCMHLCVWLCLCMLLCLCLCVFVSPGSCACPCLCLCCVSASVSVSVCLCVCAFACWCVEGTKQTFLSVFQTPCPLELCPTSLGVNGSAWQRLPFPPPQMVAADLYWQEGYRWWHMSHSACKSVAFDHENVVRNDDIFLAACIFHLLSFRCEAQLLLAFSSTIVQK